MLATSLRTHSCGDLRAAHTGQTVTLTGWVQTRRDHGGIIFVDLRDRFGITQVTFDTGKGTAAEVMATADQLRSEWCVRVTGEVVARPEGQANPRLATGEVELIARELEIFGPSETPPFEIDQDREVNEDLKLEYRYLDLRRETLQRSMQLRHDYIELVRRFFYARQFIEIQTPLLTASTPEGSRDFLVPSRFHPGNFYALPQSPQQYKQLLMVAGYDRYFQLAPAMRDEDARADRVYGVHYQFDIEMSFVGQEDIISMLEELYLQVADELGAARGFRIKDRKFLRLKYAEALERFGSDKPDIRYGLEIVDVTDLGRESEFQVFKSAPRVRGICVPGGADRLSRGQIDDLIKFTQTLGSKGLAWMRVTAEGLESNIVKFFSPEQQAELIRRFDAKPGDILFYIADEFGRSCVYLDKIRRKLADDLQLYDPKELGFVWIVDMPFFEWNDEEGKVDISHNPFSKPGCSKEEFLAAKTKEEMLAIMARQYDLACNGYELFSGGERNYDSEILDRVFQIVGYSAEEIESSFGHMLRAFRFGAPPTAGAGMGVERMLMILSGETNMKNILAFPLNQKGYDPMMKSPRPANDRQLKELGIRLAAPKKEEK